MANILSISERVVVSDFRGIQTVHETLSVKNLSQVVYSGSVDPASVEPVTLCRDFKVRLDGKEFIKGSFREIVKIPFDSSCKVGVQLYSCNRKVLNVSEIALAFFEVDGAFKVNMTIDPHDNKLYYVISQEDYKTLVKNKVYDTFVTVVDKSNNSSIVFTRKVRFN
ncbi:hypothetical protein SARAHDANIELLE_108 [Hafnia phage vB_HpaM_SarahDanielle]|uniref:Uncharacterized protein n=1 Tax=Hafnia phage vB_HpaM_SarahDanielle TaxID=2836113 RepID=A0AAE7WCM0_9CAUD|nr:hypothetical protein SARAHDANIELLE_108 [Hafnia phage vB_HpaM_SarahDanielle]